MADRLIEIVDAALASAVSRSGSHLVCRPGCSQCCHGVFEVTALDAQRLRAGLELTARRDPAKAARLRRRIAEARNHLGPFFPGDAATGLLGGDERQIELFEEWAHADACPVLDPVSQTCDLYEHRPVLCRTFGPPIRNDHLDPAAGIALCELCFTEATDSEVAAAEMESSFRGLEEALESKCRARDAGAGPTIVAFAFSGQAEASGES